MIFLTMCAMLSVVTFAPEPNEVTAHVTVQKPNGEPLEAAWISGVTTEGSWSAGTDEQGEASVKVRAGSLDDRIYVKLLWRLWPKDRETMLSKEHQEQSKKFRAELDECFWPDFSEAQFIKNDREQKEALVLIRGFERVTVRGRLASSDPATITPAMFHVFGSADTINLKRDGLIEAGARKGADGELRVSFNDHRVFWRSWTAQTAREDIDLGDIEIPAIESPGVVGGRYFGWSADDMRKAPGVGMGVMLLAIDGSHGVSLYSDSSRLPVNMPMRDPKTNEPTKFYVKTVKIAAGDYLIVPGALRLSECARRVRDALRAGEDVEKKWGIPRITIQAGKESDFLFDAEKVLQAVMGEVPPEINLQKSALVQDKPAEPKESEK